MDSMDGLVGAIASFKGQALTLSLGNAATRRPCAGCFDAWHSYRLCQCFDAWHSYRLCQCLDAWHSYRLCQCFDAWHCHRLCQCFDAWPPPVPRRLGEEAQEKNRSHRCH